MKAKWLLVLKNGLTIIGVKDTTTEKKIPVEKK